MNDDWVLDNNGQWRRRNVPDWALVDYDEEWNDNWDKKSFKWKLANDAIYAWITDIQKQNEDLGEEVYELKKQVEELKGAVESLTRMLRTLIVRKEIDGQTHT